MKNETNNFAIVYTLAKDNSPIVQLCDSKEDQIAKLAQLKLNGYPKAYACGMEHANSVLYKFGEQFEPKVLTKQERWMQWAVGVN